MPSPRITALRERYNGRDAFLAAYTPGKSTPVLDERECSVGDSPTLLMADRAWGDGTAVLLVAAQLYSLNEFTNATVKMTGQQARECAEIIVADPDYQGLKADELVLFFMRLKAGKYGHLYNAVDALHITDHLKKFTRELAAKRYKWFEEIESQRREAERREHDKAYLRPDEFRAWKEQYTARQQHGDNKQ